MKKTFYSNGKLLLTGEYLVLDGAKALALPTKFGQNLIIEDFENLEIKWSSYDYDGSMWFQETLSFDSILNFKKTALPSIKNTLLEILHEAFLLFPDFITHSQGYTISTQLTFPRYWGLGTSSTLINNIAQWLEIDAFELLKNSFGGSGYDIACAQNKSPILYHLENGKPIIEPITFDPDFSENLYFVYLNQKQNSKNAIASYNKLHKNLVKTIPQINYITHSILNTTSINAFAYQIEKHEAVMSTILEMQTIKEALFPEFNGVIKSLGAWGGDFALIISLENPIPYFKQKGFDTVLPYKDMIL